MSERFGGNSSNPESSENPKRDPKLARLLDEMRLQEALERAKKAQKKGE